MRLGIAHHLGWAVAVTASEDHAFAEDHRTALAATVVPAEGA
jgi:hypothetical protein